MLVQYQTQRTVESLINVHIQSGDSLLPITLIQNQHSIFFPPFHVDKPHTIQPELTEEHTSFSYLHVLLSKQWHHSIMHKHESLRDARPVCLLLSLIHI